MKLAHKISIAGALLLALSVVDTIYSAPPKPPGVTSADCKDNASEYAWLGVSGTREPLCFFIYRTDSSRLSVRTVPIAQP